MKKINKIAISFLIGLTGTLALNNINASVKYNGIDSNRYNKTIFGAPIYANLELDKTLDVVIDESFSEIQKLNIINAIEELDEDFTGINYNVLLNSDQAGKKCININKVENLDSSSDSLATTALTSNPFSGSVIFPVQINVDVAKIEDSVAPSLFYKRFPTIIKHEMLHVLGFADLYDEKYKDETIMYGYNAYGKTRDDLSQQDIDMVNKVYKDAQKGIMVETFEPFIISYKMERDDELDM